MAAAAAAGAPTPEASAPAGRPRSAAPSRPQRRAPGRQLRPSSAQHLGERACEQAAWHLFHRLDPLKKNAVSQAQVALLWPALAAHAEAGVGAAIEASLLEGTAPLGFAEWMQVARALCEVLGHRRLRHNFQKAEALLNLVQQDKPPLPVPPRSSSAASTAPSGLLPEASASGVQLPQLPLPKQLPLPQRPASATASTPVHPSVGALAVGSQRPEMPRCPSAGPLGGLAGPPGQAAQRPQSAAGAQAHPPRLGAPAPHAVRLGEEDPLAKSGAQAQRQSRAVEEIRALAAWSREPRQYLAMKRSGVRSPQRTFLFPPPSAELASEPPSDGRRRQDGGEVPYQAFAEERAAAEQAAIAERAAAEAERAAAEALAAERAASLAAERAAAERDALEALAAEALAALVAERALAAQAQQQAAAQVAREGGAGDVAAAALAEQGATAAEARRSPSSEQHLGLQGELHPGQQPEEQRLELRPDEEPEQRLEQRPDEGPEQQPGQRSEEQPDGRPERQPEEQPEEQQPPQPEQQALHRSGSRGHRHTGAAEDDGEVPRPHPEGAVDPRGDGVAPRGRSSSTGCLPPWKPAGSRSASWRDSGGGPLLAQAGQNAWTSWVPAEGPASLADQAERRSLRAVARESHSRPWLRHSAAAAQACRLEGEDPEDGLDLRFQMPPFVSSQVDSYKADLRDEFRRLGASTGALARVWLALEVGGAVVQVRGPHPAVEELRQLPLARLNLRGYRALVDLHPLGVSTKAGEGLERRSRAAVRDLEQSPRGRDAAPAQQQESAPPQAAKAAPAGGAEARAAAPVRDEAPAEPRRQSVRPRSAGPAGSVGPCAQLAQLAARRAPLRGPPPGAPASGGAGGAPKLWEPGGFDARVAETQGSAGRIGKARAAFHTLKLVWRHATIPRRRKLMLFRAYNITKLTYGIETLCLKRADQDKLDAFQEKCLRQVLGIPHSMVSRVTNAE
ncbi:unnamed protein product, partial [Prorocentrum cordatum]